MLNCSVNFSFGFIDLLLGCSWVIDNKNCFVQRCLQFFNFGLWIKLGLIIVSVYNGFCLICAEIKRFFIYFSRFIVSLGIMTDIFYFGSRSVDCIGYLTSPISNSYREPNRSWLVRHRIFKPPNLFAVKIIN